MTHALARYPLGQLGNSIIINENVLCLKTSNDSCTFICESKQQQMNWLRVLRFPLLSPLPVNESKGWQWDTRHSTDNDRNDDDENLLKKKSLILDAKAQTGLQEMQEKNRIKQKEKEDRELKFEKKKELQMKQYLKNHQERLLREGREEELHWTKSTKNMYKTLGVESPSSLNLTPSLLKQELTSTETPQERAAKVSRERAEALRAAREQAHVHAAVQCKTIARERREQRLKRRMQEESELFEGSTLSDLSLMSSHVQDMVDGTATVKYRHALVHSSCGEEQVRACVMIQKMWRGFMCRNVHRLLGKYFAAVMIQKAWLLYKFRRAMKKNLQKLLDNQKELARYYREQKQFKKQYGREETKVKKKAREKARLASCVTIQRGWRAWRARRPKQGRSQPKSRPAAPRNSVSLPERQYKHDSTSDSAVHPGDECSEHSDHDSKKHKKKKHKSKKEKSKKDKSKKEKVTKDRTEDAPDTRVDRSMAPSKVASTAPPPSDVSGRTGPLLDPALSVLLVTDRPFSGHRPVSGQRPITGQSLDSIHEEDSEHIDRQPASSDYQRPSVSPSLSSRPLSSSTVRRKGYSPPLAIEERGQHEPIMQVQVPRSEAKLTTKSDFFDEDGLGMDNSEHGPDHQPDHQPEQTEETESFGDGLTSSSLPNGKFKDAVRKVIIQNNVIFNIFGIDESDPDYSDEIIERQFTPTSSPLRAVRPTSPSPSSVRRGKSFRKLLSS
eukprot:CAMPEP_0114433548 /NCGR_PEP_ID=MMETSP0103-20121206/11751_1 /TAXON_ID=37642 ORGANISM="Paraphysomonas imperforata, Strain PA2" /NCGR_SAMPLE_ID=MMETSP0103 /ASSEMBLY_ACC=CAM_ASM_000201 /LENGTH=725 /DNA_ID=CAMNT_0001603305 /DNA_START=248 /DNA_END=2425 /DNA_ORIENTATION=+